MTSAIGLDLSLTGAGVGVARSGVDIEDWGEPAAEVHTFGRKGKRGETLAQRLARIETLADQIEGVIHGAMQYPDLALVETPAQNQTTGSTHDRSGLWWSVVKRMDRLGIPVIEVGITKIKMYATGKGVGAKDEIMAAMIRRYLDVPISNNNEADAFALAAMGMRLLGEPIEESLPQTHLRAMEGLVMP